MTSSVHSYAKPAYALASIIGLILLLVWMQGGFTHKTPPGTAHAAEAPPAPRGATAKAEMQAIGETMRWPGTVTARSVAQIAPKLPARILSLSVNVGDAVKAGQVVAQLDAREAQSRTDQARSALAAAEAQAVQANAELRRTQNLYQQEAATRQSLEAAEAAAQTVQAHIAQARAAIATAESMQTETVLRAPFDGTVVKRNLEPGDLAQPNAPALTIQSSQKLRVEVAIPEACARSIALGETLQALIADVPHRLKIEEIAPAADPQTRSVLVKAALDGPGAAQPGAFVWIEQSCGGRSVLLIPAAAVSRSGQLESVKLLADGQARLRHVRTGKAYGGSVEVLSGLKAGDVVVLGGGQ
ncbi:MAG: efflux RND transporter periplasmic adaptor subunit [Candidatus Methylumidiphilus sp.]